MAGSRINETNILLVAQRELESAAAAVAALKDRMKQGESDATRLEIRLDRLACLFQATRDAGAKGVSQTTVERVDLGEGESCAGRASNQGSRGFH